MEPDKAGNTLEGRKCLDMGYILQYLTTTVDMLWYYINDTERDALYSKLT